MATKKNRLDGHTKRELVELLLMEVEQWRGDAPLDEQTRERADALLARLYTCRLWIGENHWHSLCRLWLGRSARPDPWLRNTWRETLLHWNRFLIEVGYEANSRPILMARSWWPFG